LKFSFSRDAFLLAEILLDGFAVTVAFTWQTMRPDRSRNSLA
jgi:hypothetical protein